NNRHRSPCDDSCAHRDPHSFPTRRSSDLSFSTTAPHYTTSDLTSAKAALLQQIGARRIRRVFFTGRNADTGDGASMAAAVATFIDRKSTRLNSSHVKISYAVFCLKKKKRE